MPKRSACYSSNNRIKSMSKPPPMMETAKPPASVGTKLKDSCDACSAFKVKCTKEKPICSRCCKMKRSCRYSPARRAGRPHRSSHSFASKMENRSSIIAAATDQSGGGPDGILHVSGAVNHQQQGLLGVGLDGSLDKSRTAITTSASNLYSSLTLGSANTCGEGWADVQPPLTPWPESMMETSLPRPLPGNSITTTTTAATTSAASAVAAHTSAMMPSPASCCSASISGAENAAVSGTSATATNTTTSGVCGPTNNANAECSSIALDVLESLTTARHFFPGSPLLASQGMPVDDSIKVISQILICPCSQRHEVAMLAASVCNTLLDVLEHGLGHLTCASQLAQMTQELHHMANLVAQFSGRYADGVREEVEALMASALKLRLRRLINMVSGAMLRTGDSLR